MLGLLVVVVVCLVVRGARVERVVRLVPNIAKVVDLCSGYEWFLDWSLLISSL